MVNNSDSIFSKASVGSKEAALEKKITDEEAQIQADENIIWENRETSKDIVSVGSLQKNWKMFYDTEIKNLKSKL